MFSCPGATNTPMLLHRLGILGICVQVRARVGQTHGIALQHWMKRIEEDATIVSAFAGSNHKALT